MPSIWYRKQKFGKWRRIDGKLATLVTEEAMFREIHHFVSEGWNIVPHGVLLISSYEIVKDSPRS